MQIQAYGLPQVWRGAQSGAVYSIQAEVNREACNGTHHDIIIITVEFAVLAVIINVLLIIYGGFMSVY